MKKYNYFLVTCMMLLFSMTASFAQSKEAKITLTFDKVDSAKVCKALVTSEGVPVKDVNINFSVKRLFSNLSLGDAVATDSTGVATLEIPKDLPSHNGKLIVFAKIIDNENYANTEASGEVNGGTVIVVNNSNVEERSIFGGRNRAPIYFIVVSLLAIGLVWGTLVYSVLQVFKIKKLSSANKN
jgi:putative cell wall-binding protein